jgi:hypothetical protein
MIPFEKQAAGGLMDSVNKYFAETKSFAPAYAGAALGAGALGMATMGRRAGENPRQRALRVLRNAAAGGLLGGVGLQAALQGGGTAIANTIIPGLGGKIKPGWRSSVMGRVGTTGLMVGAGNLINQRLRLWSLGKALPSMGLGTVDYRLAQSDQRTHLGAGPRGTTATAKFPAVLKVENASKPREIQALARNTDKALRDARAQHPKSMESLFSRIEQKARGGRSAVDPEMMAFLRANYSRNGARGRFNTGSAGRALNFVGSGARTATGRRIGLGGSVLGVALGLASPEISRWAFGDPAKKVVDSAGNYLTSSIPGIGEPPLEDDSWWDSLNKGHKLW